MNENEAARHADGFDFLAGLDLVVVARSPQARPVEEGRRRRRPPKVVVRISSIAAAVASVRSVDLARVLSSSAAPIMRYSCGLATHGDGDRRLLAGEGIERWSQSFVLSPVWMVLQNLILEGNFTFIEY